MNQRFEVTNGEVLPGFATLIRFDGPVASVSVATGGSPVMKLHNPRANWTGLLWDAPVAPDSSVRILVESAETVRIQSVRWLTSDKGTLDFVPAATEDQPDLLRTFLDEAQNSDTDETRRRYQRFFYDYSVETDRYAMERFGDLSTPEREFRVAVIRDGTELLRRRLLRRIEAHPQKPDPASLETFPDPVTAYLSSLQLGLYRRHFGESIDTDDAEGAFSMFASGELRISATGTLADLAFTYEPNGSNLFLFAEFALLAMQREIDAAAWQQIVGGLLRMQHVFMLAYAKTNASAGTLAGYRPPPLEGEAFARDLKQLRRELPVGVLATDPAAEMGRNAAKAFPQEGEGNV